MAVGQSVFFQSSSLLNHVLCGLISFQPVGKDLILSSISIQTPRCSLSVGALPCIAASRMSFTPVSTHSQSVCTRQGMFSARVAHASVLSSPLIAVCTVRDWI